MFCNPPWMRLRKVRGDWTVQVLGVSRGQAKRVGNVRTSAELSAPGVGNGTLGPGVALSPGVGHPPCAEALTASCSNFCTA